jgi:hypothetical protein
LNGAASGPISYLGETMSEITYNEFEESNRDYDKEFRDEAIEAAVGIDLTPQDELDLRSMVIEEEELDEDYEVFCINAWITESGDLQELVNNLLDAAGFALHILKEGYQLIMIDDDNHVLFNHPEGKKFFEEDGDDEEDDE